MKPPYLLFAFALFIFSCSNDNDEGPTLKITPEQIELLHNGSEKTWRVAQVYRDYNYSRLDDMKPCIEDDTYTFFADSNEVRMNMGEKSCFYEDPDEQATTLTFTYYPEEGQAYLDHGRAEAKDNTSSAILYILELEEISENRLFFANGKEGNWGRVLILEAID